MKMNPLIPDKIKKKIEEVIDWMKTEKINSINQEIEDDSPKGKFKLIIQKNCIIAQGDINELRDRIIS